MYRSAVKERGPVPRLPPPRAKSCGSSGRILKAVWPVGSSSIGQQAARLMPPAKSSRTPMPKRAPKRARDDVLKKNEEAPAAASSLMTALMRRGTVSVLEALEVELGGTEDGGGRQALASR